MKAVKQIVTTTYEEVSLGDLKITSMTVHELAEFLAQEKFMTCQGVACSNCPLGRKLNGLSYDDKSPCRILLDLSKKLRGVC